MTDPKRRFDVERNTPEELQIVKAIVAVKMLGDGPDLAACVVALTKALGHLSDYVDENPQPAGGDHLPETGEGSMTRNKRSPKSKLTDHTKEPDPQ